MYFVLSVLTWRPMPTPSGAGYCLEPDVSLIRGMPTGRRYFLPCRTRVSFGPATGPTLKKPCAKSYVGGTYDKYQRPLTPAAHSRLYNRDSARASVFAWSAISSCILVRVRNRLCGLISTFFPLPA